MSTISTPLLVNVINHFLILAVLWTAPLRFVFMKPASKQLFSQRSVNQSDFRTLQIKSNPSVEFLNRGLRQTLKPPQRFVFEERGD